MCIRDSPSGETTWYRRRNGIFELEVEILDPDDAIVQSCLQRERSNAVRQQVKEEVAHALQDHQQQVNQQHEQQHWWNDDGWHSWSGNWRQTRRS